MFSPDSATESYDLLTNASRVVISWRSVDPDAVSVVDDALGRRMAVSRITFVSDNGSDRVYLVGYPASKVTAKAVGPDTIPGTLEMDDHLAAMVELAPMLEGVYTQTRGLVGSSYFRRMLAERTKVSAS